MAQLYTESEACERYKQAILDSREQLEAFLYPLPWVYLENNRCLTQEELESIKISDGGAKLKIKKLLDLILTKTDIATLSGFSKAVYSKNTSKGQQIFPFADNLGGVPVVDPKRALPPLSDKPTVLWLVSSKADCKSIISVSECTQIGVRKFVGPFSCQEYSIAGEHLQSLHIVYPTEEQGTHTTMTGPVDLLHQFSPRPHMVVTTGTCCANRGEAQLGDVCVVRSGNQQLSLFAELEHMLEVWRLESGGSLVPKELKPPRSMYQQMVCLARIYTELELSEVERSLWFKRLELDVTKPLSANSGVRRCVPNPEALLQPSTAGSLWSQSTSSPLHNVPCDQLSREARASMIYSAENHSFVSDPAPPQVLFCRTSRFKRSEGTAVCSPRAADLYKAARMVNMKLEKRGKNDRPMPYIAALGVSSVDGEDCEEEEYERFANIFSIHVMWKIIKYLL